jgi:hypothetical protein
MTLRIDSSNYDNITEPDINLSKFQSLRYSLAGSADYVALTGLVTAWKYTVVVSASAWALGGGVSAGGVDSLRASFAKATALTFVSNEAVTATAWFTQCTPQQQLNPTNYIYQLALVKAT